MSEAILFKPVLPILIELLIVEDRRRWRNASASFAFVRCYGFLRVHVSLSGGERYALFFVRVDAGLYVRLPSPAKPHHRADDARDMCAVALALPPREKGTCRSDRTYGVERVVVRHRRIETVVIITDLRSR